MKFDPERIEKLVELFRETAKAHSEQLDEPEVHDPEWTSWYAAHLREPLNELLDSELDQERIAALFEEAEQEHIITSPGREWSAYYADFFIARAM